MVKVSGHMDAAVDLSERVNECELKMPIVLAYVNAIVADLGSSIAGGERSASGRQP